MGLIEASEAVELARALGSEGWLPGFDIRRIPEF
jgi:hypothetical protein